MHWFRAPLIQGATTKKSNQRNNNDNMKDAAVVFLYKSPGKKNHWNLRKHTDQTKDIETSIQLHLKTCKNTVRFKKATKLCTFFPCILNKNILFDLKRATFTLKLCLFEDEVSQRWDLSFFWWVKESTKWVRFLFLISLLNKTLLVSNIKLLSFVNGA